MQSAKIAKLIYRQNIPNEREIWYICLFKRRPIAALAADRKDRRVLSY